ncbi:MAG: P-II family nitrogen regulator [Methanomassiliicoccus sp.]|nr:P-II family nitrogen regulator [Methanomassiliicoccus sp.]
MKEIMAIVRMNKTSVTKKALIEAGVAGFTAVKVMGRGRLVTDPAILEEKKVELMKMAHDDINDPKDVEHQVVTFLNGSRPFPRRLFTVLVHDEDVPRVIEAISTVNRTEGGIGDGLVLVLPVVDAIRVRTGESGEAAIW